MTQLFRFIGILCLSLWLCGCSPVVQTQGQPLTETGVAETTTAVAVMPTIEPTRTAAATPTTAPSATAAVAGLEASATPRPQATQAQRMPAERWQEWPVVPVVSAKARQVLADGIAQGNNPKAFSKIGDCETNTEWFLTDFDKGADHYILGPYQDLQETIGFYAGSFGRTGYAAQRGFTAASVLNTYWRDAEKCQKNESPLDCELRLNKPAFALIMLGTNDASRPETFEKNLRAVIEATLKKNVLPVLATKADNLEGDHRINQATARLAAEYDIPLWNFWGALQTLPDKGLQEDKSHLTFAPNDFSDPGNFERAWPVRNLTALQLLEALRQASGQ